MDSPLSESVGSPEYESDLLSNLLYGFGIVISNLQLPDELILPILGSIAPNQQLTYRRVRLRLPYNTEIHDYHRWLPGMRLPSQSIRNEGLGVPWPWDTVVGLWHPTGWYLRD
jgi:hypothetical protein